MKLDAFTQSYIETALWSTMDESTAQAFGMAIGQRPETA